jgi:hypothetical protein
MKDKKKKTERQKKENMKAIKDEKMLKQVQHDR